MDVHGMETMVPYVQVGPDYGEVICRPSPNYVISLVTKKRSYAPNG